MLSQGRLTLRKEAWSWKHWFLECEELVRCCPHGRRCPWCPFPPQAHFRPWHSWLTRPKVWFSAVSILILKCRWRDSTKATVMSFADQLTADRFLRSLFIFRSISLPTVVIVAWISGVSIYVEHTHTQIIDLISMTNSELAHILCDLEVKKIAKALEGWTCVTVCCYLLILY